MGFLFTRWLGDSAETLMPFPEIYYLGFLRGPHRATHAELAGPRRATWEAAAAGLRGQVRPMLRLGGAEASQRALDCARGSPVPDNWPWVDLGQEEPTWGRCFVYEGLACDRSGSLPPLSLARLARPSPASRTFKMSNTLRHRNYSMLNMALC